MLNGNKEYQQSPEVKYAIDFRQLCIIKREKMKLNIAEAAKKMGYLGLNTFESGKSIPRPTNYKKLVKFYQITEEEISACKPTSTISLTSPRKKKNSIQNVLNELTLLTKKVSSYHPSGKLGKTIAEEGKKSLDEAYNLLKEIQILDDII